MRPLSLSWMLSSRARSHGEAAEAAEAIVGRACSLGRERKNQR
jgi:hypothetical protein